SDGFKVGEDRRQPVSAGPTADRGLQADKASMAGGTPDRAAAVRGDCSRDEARRDACRRAAARAPGREVRVPWIARHAEKVIARIALERELRRVRLADDDYARAPQPRNGQFVPCRP